MTNRHKHFRLLFLFGLLLLAGWVWWSTRLPTPPWKIVEVGVRLTSDSLDISRTLVVVPPKLGVLFSTVRKPGRQEEFAYLIVFRYGPRLTSYSELGPNRPSPRVMLEQFGNWAEATANFELNGKRIDASYHADLNETHSAVANETLRINGRDVDMRSGRLFLIDLTAELPVYQQINIDLQAPPSKLETREDAERAAETIRQTLKSQGSEIKTFMQ